MTLTLELPDRKEAALKAKAQARGLSAEEYASEVLDRDLGEEDVSGTALHRHISEVIRERMRHVPAEAWAQLPTDGASEHDHYIHGLPKRDS